EKALRRIEGVQEANVNFAARSAAVEYDPQRTDPQSLAQAVRDAGYGAEGARDAGAQAAGRDSEQQAREEAYRDLTRRLLAAVVFGLPVTLLAMLHLDFPGSHWIQLLLTTPVMLYSGRPFFVGARDALRRRAADMNTLIAMGTGAAYGFSVVAT